MRLAHTIALAATLSAALACGGSRDQTADETSAAADASAPTPSSEPSILGGGSEIKLVLTGGPKPGTYDKKSEDPTCTVGYASKGAWGNAASDVDDKEGLVGIDLIVPDPVAAKRGTDNFMVAIYLDDRLDPKNQFVIEPKKGKGRGTVTIDDRGETAKVTVRGTTAQGVGVDATIDCDQILRGG